jgi:putative ABC transport system permease protein
MPSRSEPRGARALMGPSALFYLYRRRLRQHAASELLAGAGVAVAVALVFATTVVTNSVTGSAADVVHAVTGRASLQIRARDAAGLDERLLARVEDLPGVKQAAPLLEQSATIVVSTPAHPRHVTVDLAGADTSLVVLDGLAHTLPTSVLAGNGIGLSSTTAGHLGLPASASAAQEPTSVPDAAGEVTLDLRGEAISLPISAVLGRASFGALSQAQVAVMPLAHLQALAGLRGRLTRILVQTQPGHEAAVRAQLRRIGAGRLDVEPADEDLTLLKQALRPSNQASDFFAAISAMLGFLFAFNALLLTIPERRQAIADLRLIGTKRTAIVQMFVFQSLCLGVAASLVGLLAGYGLSEGVLHESSGYLAEAFTLSSGSVVPITALVLTFAGGVLATCLAAAVPLLDLRRGHILDSLYDEDVLPVNALTHDAQVRLALGAAGLLAITTAIYAFSPSLALLGCALLALATVLAVPLALAGVLGLARALSERREALTVLPVALTSLRTTTLRTLALAATGAVALFGAVALGGARNDLLHGIGEFSRGYSADADIWVTNPGDNQAVDEFSPGHSAALLRNVPGVASVQSFQGGFLQLNQRRVWIIARPPGANREVLDSQITAGEDASAIARVGQGGAIAVSKQIADEHHTGVGGTLTLPTPTGDVRFEIAATTTNLAWSPGAIFMSTADYGRYWSPTHPPAPTAFGVRLLPGANVEAVRHALYGALGSASGLEVSTAATREARINALTGEGLSQLGLISTFLLVAAILALAAALTSAIWQRRVGLAELRFSGVLPHRLRWILLVESTLMLSAGCVTGAIAGIYGQLVIDAYLAHVTGFPVARVGASLRPLEIFVVVIALVTAIVTVPGWLASRVPPIFALNE